MKGNSITKGMYIMSQFKPVKWSIFTSFFIRHIYLCVCSMMTTTTTQFANDSEKCIWQAVREPIELVFNTHNRCGYHLFGANKTYCLINMCSMHCVINHHIGCIRMLFASHRNFSQSSSDYKWNWIGAKTVQRLDTRKLSKCLLTDESVRHTTAVLSRWCGCEFAVGIAR